MTLLPHAIDYSYGTDRWATYSDEGRDGWINGYTTFARIGLVYPLVEVGEYLQAKTLIWPCVDSVGVGLALFGPDRRGVIVYQDNHGRVGLWLKGEGEEPPEPPPGRRTHYPVHKHLRLGYVAENTWRGESSDDGIEWTPVGDDVVYELEPVAQGHVRLSWSWAQAFVRSGVWAFETGSLA